MATLIQTRIKQPIFTGSRSLLRFLQNLRSTDMVLSFLFMLAGLILWVVSLPRIDLSQMNDLGFISVMPPGSFIALVLLTTAFVVVIRRSRPVAVLAALELVVLLFAQHGITALVEPLARFGPAWRHVGVVDYIIQNGSVNPRIDAYFNWPGFFSGGALLTEAAGLNNAASFLPWASFVLALLYLCPLWMIYTSFTDDRRLAWAGLWIFSLSNWVGQDYFSPQGINFFFFLVVVAVLLKWFKSGAAANIPVFLKRSFEKVKVGSGLVERLLQPDIISPPAAAPKPARFSPTYGLQGRRRPRKQRFEAAAHLTAGVDRQKLLMLILVVVYIATVVSHQLTPFAVIIAVSALALINRISARKLPVLMLVLVTIWILSMASAFMNSRIEALLSDMGNIDQMIVANLADRMVGSPGHQSVVHVRMILTSGLWLVALIGGVRRWRAGYTDTNAIILSLSPFLLLAMVAYGGEMLLRVFLFSLPFFAFMAAALFFPRPVLKPSWIQIVSFGAVISVMAFSFFLVRYGNERMESFTLAEQQAVQYLYQTAPEGSLLASSTSHMPYKYQDYRKYRYVLFNAAILSDDMNAIVSKMGDEKYTSAFLILTRAQRAQLEMFYSFNAADMDHFQQELAATGRFQLIYSNEDAEIYQFTKRGTVP